jgi:hypothetical protein
MHVVLAQVMKTCFDSCESCDTSSHLPMDMSLDSFLMSRMKGNALMYEETLSYAMLCYAMLCYVCGSVFSLCYFSRIIVLCTVNMY